MRANQLLQQNNRCFRRAQQPYFQRLHFTFGFHAIERRKHQREGFFFAVFAFTQTAHGRFVMGGDDEMKSAQSLDGNDLAAPDVPGGGAQGLMPAKDRFAGWIPQFEMRTANRTGIRLGVKTAVVRIVVFRPALWAHRE